MTDRPDLDELERLLANLIMEARRAEIVQKAEARKVETLREALRALDDWANRRPDAGFNTSSPRWSWWHERPAAQVRAALEGTSDER